MYVAYGQDLFVIHLLGSTSSLKLPVLDHLRIYEYCWWFGI